MLGNGDNNDVNQGVDNPDSDAVADMDNIYPRHLRTITTAKSRKKKHKVAKNSELYRNCSQQQQHHYDHNHQYHHDPCNDHMIMVNHFRVNDEDHNLVECDDDHNNDDDDDENENDDNDNNVKDYNDDNEQEDDDDIDGEEEANLGRDEEMEDDDVEDLQHKGSIDLEVDNPVHSQDTDPEADADIEVSAEEDLDCGDAEDLDDDLEEDDGNTTRLNKIVDNIKTVATTILTDNSTKPILKFSVSAILGETNRDPARIRRNGAYQGLSINYYFPFIHS